MLYYVRYGPHHSTTAIYWGVCAYRLIHPHNVTKAKVQRHKRSDDNQNEQVISTQVILLIWHKWPNTTPAPTSFSGSWERQTKSSLVPSLPRRV